MVLVGLSFIQTLQDILTTVFTNVLMPVLTSVANIILATLGDLIIELLAKVFMRVLVVFLKLIAFLEDVFNVFSGVSEVKLDNVSTNQSFLDYLFQLSDVQTVMLAITLISFALAFLVTIVSIMRSMSDMAMEDKNPLSQVLRDAVKTALTLVMVPAVCLFSLMLASNVLVVISEEFDFGSTGSSDLSDLVFITVAGDQLKNQADWDYYSGDHHYEDVDAVIEDFYVWEINYILAVFAVVALSIILLVTILQSVLRIFMLLLLYLVSPLVAAMMPLDGGKKFQDWKKMFLALTVSAFMPVLAMKLYMMIMSSVFSTTTPIDFGVNALATLLIKVLLMVGGAYAVYRSRNVLAQIIEPSVVHLLDAPGMFADRGAQMASRSISQRMGSSKKSG